MNSNRLTKHYSYLPPHERLALIVAAEHRGDESELNHLRQSSHTVTFQVPDYYLVARRLDVLANRYVSRQLELIARFHQLSGLPCDGPRKAESYVACLFVTNSEGWTLFCGELGVEPGAPLANRVGVDLINEFDQLMRLFTFSLDDALAWLSETEPDAEPLPTAAGLAEEMSAIFFGEQPKCYRTTEPPNMLDSI